MDARERIPSHGILDKIDHEVFMAIQNRDAIDCVSDATSNIIAIVRQALLSEEAVSAACSDRNVQVVTDHKIYAFAINIDMNNALAAAINHAFGEEPRREEER